MSCFARETGGRRARMAKLATRLLLASVLWGAPAALPAAPPAATGFFPTGARRGESAVLAASGDVGAWPVSAWVERAGLRLTAQPEKGRFLATADADAPPGVYWTRLVNNDGVSKLLPVFVGQVAEQVESEPNDAPRQAGKVELPATLSGKLGKAGDVDVFEFSLDAGQTVVASLVGHNVLASPTDAVLQVCELRNFGAALVGETPPLEAVTLAHNDDARGLDPLVVFTAPRAGRYAARVFAFPETPDSGIAFAGGDRFVYRLTLAAGGVLDYPLPLATRRGEPASLRCVGWNAPPEAPRIEWTGEITPPAPAEQWWRRGVVSVFHPALVGDARLPVRTHPCLAASDENGTERPLRAAPPATVSGCLATPGAAHAIRFDAKKGRALRVQAEARSLGFELDPVLALFDSGGKKLQEVDDAANNQRDPELVVTPTTDGELTLVLRDAHRHGGPRHAYRLTLTPVVADFALEIGESFVLAAGGQVELPVTVQRLGGFAETIEIRVEHLPPGARADVATSQPTGDSAKQVKLALRAEAGAAAANQPIRVVGRAAPSDKRPASDGVPPSDSHRDSDSGEREATFAMPAGEGRSAAVWLTITPAK